MSDRDTIVSKAVAEIARVVSNVYSEAVESRFDVLEKISTSYWGKQMYFLQDNGTVHDRYRGEYITLEEAVDRFARIVKDDG